MIEDRPLRYVQGELLGHGLWSGPLLDERELHMGLDVDMLAR